jgi:hypothetical protein
VLKDGRGWHYVYSMQRQAGALEAMNLQVTLPSCAAIYSASAGVTVDSKRQAHIAQVLSRDTNVNIDYTCPV